MSPSKSRLLVVFKLCFILPPVYRLTEMLSGSSSFLAVSDSMEKDVLRADLSSKLFVKKDEVRENLRYIVMLWGCVLTPRC